MKQSKTAVQSGLRGAKAALEYIIVSLSAVLTAVILSVLFSVTAGSDGEEGLTGGGFVVALQPAYLRLPQAQRELRQRQAAESQPT